MKITEFTAEVTLLGKTRTIRVSDNSVGDEKPTFGVTIEPMDADETRQMIGILTGSAESPVVGKVTPEAKPEPEKPTAPKGGPAKKKETTPVANKPEPEKVEAKEEPAADPEPEPEKPKPEPKKTESKKNGAAEKPASTGAAALSVDLPDAIKNTSSMRDLLTYLADNGCKDIETMVATCISLKATVPILGKVPDVDTRVRRATEVLGLFAPPEEDATAG